ncbi:MAG: WYL domain-containing protein, partial [Actinomycetota bacterium]|nr:WYL domain-containing protein [Actinomycetota bacterium]
GDQVAVLVRLNPARREDLVGTALAVLAEDTDADGWLRLEVTLQDARHAEWALWQLSTNAEALSPQWLRTSLRDRATAIADRYGAAATYDDAP